MSRRHAAGERWSLRLASALALGLVLSACGGQSQYRYVTSSDSTVYFKVPTEWKSFSNTDLVLAEAQVNQAQGKPQSNDDLRSNIALNWRIGFDASAKPSPIDVVIANTDHFVVDVRVRTLTAEERRTVNLDELRNLIVPIDQLQAQKDQADKEQGPNLVANNDFVVRVDQEITKPGGYHGVQTIVDLRGQAPDTNTYVFNNVALLNADNTKLYVLSIHCESICYDQNRESVQTVVKSFTLKAK